MRVYRLQGSRFPLINWKGAEVRGGRWNQIGTAMIYTSATMSLAALEILVHHNSIPIDFVGIEVRIPDDLRVSTPADLGLPVDWPEVLPTEVTAEYGSKWVAAAKTVALKIPSAVVPSEFNYLLNPNHRDFGSLHFRYTKIRFDSRLILTK